MIYLDHAATTAVSPAALEAMLPYFSQTFGNPSSTHAAGADASFAVERAREDIAAALGCTAREVEFTGSGTEADNQALLTLAAVGEAAGKRHLVASAIEHPAVLRVLERLHDERGFAVTLVAPDAAGIVQPDALEAALRPDTCGASLMWANNEIGTVQPVAAVAALCHAHGILFHTDAVQAAGLLPIDCSAADIDLLSISAHKFAGPKGVGALAVRGGVEPAVLLVGGAQERGHRAGTLNVPGIVGMAAALATASADLPATAARITALRMRLEAGLLACGGVRLMGGEAAAFARAPHITCACFAGIEREVLLAALDQQGICASGGSACAAGSLEASHVLAALQVPADLARGMVRFSLGRTTTEADIDRTVEVASAIVRRLRARKGIR